MTSDPDRMLLILDSAVIAGNLKPEEAELDKAKCYYMAEREDTALVIVNNILNSNAYGDNEKLHADILVFKTQIEASNDVLSMSKTAEEASALCHKIGGDYLVYAADMDSRIGGFLVSIGHEEEGFKRINEAIAAVDNPKDIHELQSLFNCYRRKMISLSEIGDFSAITKLCDKILRRLNSLEANGIKNTSPEALASIIDQNRGCFNSHKALALSETGKFDEAREALEECLKTNWSKRILSITHIIEIYANLDMFKEFDEACEVIEKKYNFKENPSTIYIKFLKTKAVVAEKKGYNDTSLKLYKDALEIQNKLNKIKDREELARAFAVYKVNETEQKIYKSELENSRLKVMLLTILLVVIVLGAITLHALTKKRKKRELTQSIIERHEPDITMEAKGTKESVEDKTVKQMAELYASIKELMDSKKPYIDPEFDITKLAKLLGTNNAYVSRTINGIEGKNFRTWLSEYRNNIVIRCICDNNDVDITELCELAGYANRETICRHFKNLNGITIGDFKEQLKAH